MNRRNIFGVFAITALGLTLLPGNAVAQQKSLKDQLVGAWMFVSSTTKLPDGTPVWGSNPKGLTIFTDNGRYSSHVMSASRPKFRSNSRITGTPDENKATVAGSLGYSGTYSVSDKTLAFKIEASTYPNAVGDEQKRSFTLTGDELKYTNTAPTAGGTAEAVLKRVK